MDAELIPWLFASVLAVGMTYLLLSIFFGSLLDVEGGADLDMDMDMDVDLDLDVDAGGLDVDGASDAGEARGLGCSAIAAFCTGFGSMGLLGSLSGWELPFSVLAGLIFGLIFGRTFITAMRFVLRQQSTDVVSGHTLIGSYARITVDTPPGKTGEALLEADTVMKYPVRAAGDNVALKKGDYVEVVDVEGGRLYVKKKRGVMEE